MNLNTDLSVKQLNYIANNISGETKDLYTARRIKCLKKM